MFPDHMNAFLRLIEWNTLLVSKLKHSSGTSEQKRWLQQIGDLDTNSFFSEAVSGIPEYGAIIKVFFPTLTGLFVCDEAVLVPRTLRMLSTTIALVGPNQQILNDFTVLLLDFCFTTQFSNDRS